MLAREAAIQAEQRRKAVANFNGSTAVPFPNYRSITDKYGNRTHPIRKTKDFHSGVDIAGASGSDILAAESGTVIFSGRNSGYGNYIIVDHGGGVSTLYAHASRLLFSEGAKVTRGQAIAKVGSTGISTGPHLHFEVRIYGEHTNPQTYLGY